MFFFVENKIHVQNGTSRGFRFDGVGSVMNEAEPYGGLVYGYNDSVVAIWVPTSLKRNSENAAVFMLGRIWGSGFNEEKTNNVEIIFNVMDILMPVCLLEVNTTKTSLVASFRYDKINDSVLKFAVGDEITMHCNYGYKAVHPNFTMVCKDENNGSWSHDPIECHVECPNPEVNNTNVITMDNSPGGYVVSLTCKGRHRHISGDLERTCNRNGTWTGTPPVCKECKCTCSAIGSIPIKSNETKKLEQRIGELRSLLTVQKNMTAKARRRKVCASDPRPSAQGVGVVMGVGVLVVIISSIVILDLPSLISSFK